MRKSIKKTVQTAGLATYLVSSMMYTGCQETDYYDPSIGNKSPLPELNVSETFDWSVIQKVAVQVTVNNQYEGNPNYIVSIYANNPMGNNPILLAKDLTNGNRKILTYVAVPKSVKSLYITQTMKMEGGSERTSMKVIPIENTIALCDFTNASYTTQKSNVKSVNKIQGEHGAPEITIPDNAIEIEGSEKITLKKGEKYVIKAGKTFTGQIEWSWGQNTEFYVEGTYAPKNSYIELNGNAEMFVLSEGKVEAQSIFLTNNANMTTLGTCDIKNRLTIDGDGVKFLNYGSIIANEITLTANASFYNYCYVQVNETLDLQGNKNVVIGEQALTTTKALNMNNSFIKISYQGMLNVSGNANFLSGNTIQADDNAAGEAITALAKFGSITAQWKGVSFLNRLQVFFKNGNTYNQDYVEFKNNVTIAASEDETIAIYPSGCNGEGNNPKKPGKPEAPEYPLDVKISGVYTYLMEDMWPSYGDYDLNDLVGDLSIGYTLIDSENHISKMDVSFKLRAVGATQQLGAAIQLDKVLSEHIESVVERDETPRNLNGSVFACQNGIEINQSKAVIPFFDNAHTLLGVSQVPVNTEHTAAEPQTVNLSINFKNNTVKKEDIDIQNINFFIAYALKNGIRSEVHLKGYSPTDKIDKSLLNTKDDQYNKAPYTSLHNLVWGIMIPQEEGSTFHYPKERVSIREAYKEFSDWANSNGSINTDWYKKMEASKVY